MHKIVKGTGRIKANKKYKDRLFIAVFGHADNKEYALSLYNALNGTSFTDVSDLEIYTIKNVLYLGKKNDVSFIIDDSLNLYEHQSTYNPNMPLRGLFYFSKQYQKYVGADKEDMYSSKRKMIPTPKYVVFYNGSDDRPEREVLKLSDSFMNKNYTEGSVAPSLEVQTLVLNINYGNNKELLRLCRPLEHYSKFVSYVKIAIEEGYSLNDSLDIAIDKAITENLLDGFFENHRNEVKDMILSDYDPEKLKKVYYRDGKEDARDEILKSLGLTLEQYEKIVKAREADPTKTVKLSV